MLLDFLDADTFLLTLIMFMDDRSAVKCPLSPLTGRRNGLISPQSHSSTSPPVSKSQLSKEEKFRARCGLEDWGDGRALALTTPQGDMSRDLLCVFAGSWRCDSSGNGPAAAHSPSLPGLPPCGAGTGCLLLESTRAFKPVLSSSHDIPWRLFRGEIQSA